MLCKLSACMDGMSGMGAMEPAVLCSSGTSLSGGAVFVCRSDDT